MPDDTLQGKRLYLARLAGAGLASDVRPSQQFLDRAAELVERVVAEAIRPYHQLTGAFLAIGAAFGLVLGVVIGFGVAWGVWR